MPTRRRPIKRLLRTRVSPDVLAAFSRLQEAEAACTCGGDSCSACDAWWHNHNVIHGALGLKPWQWPAVLNPDADCAAGSPSDDEAHALYRKLAELVGRTP
jgi:hypothetical protein